MNYFIPTAASGNCQQRSPVMMLIIISYYYSTTFPQNHHLLTLKAVSHVTFKLNQTNIQ